MPNGIVTLNKALEQLATQKKAADRHAKKVLEAREATEQRLAMAIETGIMYLSAGVAGAADAMVGDFFDGVTPAELLGVGAGIISMTGILGEAGSMATGAGAKGSLSYAIGRRAYSWAGGDEEEEEAAGGAVAGPALLEEEDDDIEMVEMREKLAEADALVD